MISKQVDFLNYTSQLQVDVAPALNTPLPEDQTERVEQLVRALPAFKRVEIEGILKIAKVHSGLVRPLHKTRLGEGGTFCPHLLIEKTGGIYVRLQEPLGSGTHKKVVKALHFSPSGTPTVWAWAIVKKNVKGAKKEVELAARWHSPYLMDPPHLCLNYLGKVGKPKKIKSLMIAPCMAGDLTHLLKSQDKLSPSDEIECGYQLAKAIHYLHGEGYLHRDIKPNNVFWMGNPLRFKLADFGATRKKWAVFENQLAGNEAFRPPESKNKTFLVDETWDIFALGKTLARVIQGKGPFHEAARHLVQEQCQDEDPKKRPTAKKMVECFEKWIQEVNGSNQNRLPIIKTPTPRAHSPVVKKIKLEPLPLSVSNGASHSKAPDLPLNSNRTHTLNPAANKVNRCLFN